MGFTDLLGKSTSSSDTTKKNEKNWTPWIILVVIMSVLTITGVALAVYFATKKDSSGDKVKAKKNGKALVLSSQANPGPGYKAHEADMPLVRVTLSNRSAFQTETGIHYILYGLNRNDLILKLPVIPVNNSENGQESYEPNKYELYSYPRVRITPMFNPAARSVLKITTQLPNGTVGFYDPIVVDTYTKVFGEEKPYVTYDYLYNKWERKWYRTQVDGDLLEGTPL